MTDKQRRYLHSSVITFLTVFLGTLSVSLSGLETVNWGVVRGLLLGAALVAGRAVVKIFYEKFITNDER